MTIPMLPQIIHDTVHIVNGVDAMDVLNKVDSFYKTSWSNLTTSITICISITILVIPFVLFIVQKRNMEKLEVKLKAAIDEHMDAQATANEYKFSVIEDRQYASTFTLQGRIQVGEGLYSEAIDSFISAAIKYIERKENHTFLSVPLGNIGAALSKLSSKDLSIINKQFTEIKHSNLSSIIRDIKLKNVSTDCNDAIKNINIAMERIEKKIAI